MKRSEWILKMRKLYKEIIQQYTAKGFSEERAKKIARKVISRISKKHHFRVFTRELEVTIID